MRLLLTNGTATGREQGAALLQPGDVQVWQPWDTPAATGRFLKHFKPRFGVLIETEIWPNLVAQCVAANTPLCLVNARCNDKTYRKARQLAWLSRPAYAGLSAVWAQSQHDADRLTALGARVLGITGNFKFDATPDAALLARAKQVRQRSVHPVLMFASSREGEEQMLLDVLKQKVPSTLADQAQSAINNVASMKVQWLLVPRHPQRFDAVTALCQSAGFSVSRRSTWVNDEPQAADIWLGDSVGEMALYFGMADVALLGGSFAPLGGQNLIEAAACGCPVVMGPHTFNFTEASQLAVQAGAAFEQPDIAAAVGKAMQLVADASALAAAKSAASALSLAHRGAAQRTAFAIKELI
jgi:3-deoxy-D-manno-octulosonic-acid transferase